MRVRQRSRRMETEDFAANGTMQKDLKRFACKPLGRPCVFFVSLSDIKQPSQGIRDWFGEEKEVSRRKPPDSKEYSYKDLCAGTGGFSPSNRPTCVDDPLQITVDGFKTAILGLSDGTSKSSSRRSVEAVSALRSLCVFHGVFFHCRL
eukprot:symbB.v1.2.010041.t1/scaffold650.1/size176305/20